MLSNEPTGLRELGVSRATASSISIQTGSRLHFGLLLVRLAGSAAVRRPGDDDRAAGDSADVESAGEFAVRGLLADRVQAFASAWARSYRLAAPPRCEVTVVSAAPQHAGLGTGTQLGLAVAAGLAEFHSGTRPAAVELAAAVGRGRRSSIGTYGFDLGGLLYEDGKAPGETIGRLHAHVETPADWRVVLVGTARADGLSGDAEVRAFGSLPPVPAVVTQRLKCCVEEHLLPAAREGNLPEFAEHLYQYGHEAGMCFAACQGGPYAGPHLERWVEQIRPRGYAGVGQSSWGPTLFVVVDSDAAAQELIGWFQRDVARDSPDRVWLESTAVSRPSP